MAEVEVFELPNQQLVINDIIVGNAIFPTELIRVKAYGIYYLVQVYYDTGAQVTLCNYKCGPQILASRVADRPIGIITVHGTIKKVRKIHKVCLGEKHSAEAILIPTLQLKNTTTSKQEIWKEFNKNWAY